MLLSNDAESALLELHESVLAWPAEFTLVGFADTEQLGRCCCCTYTVTGQIAVVFAPCTVIVNVLFEVMFGIVTEPP